MDTKTIVAAATKAGEQVKNLPAEFRGFAFQVVFARLLNESPGRIRPAAGSSDGPFDLNEGDRGELMREIMASNLDFSRYYNLVSKGSWVIRVMVVLYVLEKILGVKALTPSELAKIMKDKLRLPSVYPPNIGRALTGEMEYFIRSQEGQAYKYSLSNKGIDKVEKLIDA